MKYDRKPSIRSRDVLTGAGGLLITWAMPERAVATVAADGDPPLDQVDSFLAIAADGHVTARNGQVDLGTGIHTATFPALLAFKVQWKHWAGLPELGHLEPALRANPSKPRVPKEDGDIDAALGTAGTVLTTSYIWPYQMHGSIGPSCALTDVRDNETMVWSGTQNPYELRADLAKLLGLPADKIHVVRVEAVGCYGRNCADDVAADAVLLSRAVGRPVRVQLTRDQEPDGSRRGGATH